MLFRAALPVAADARRLAAGSVEVARDAERLDRPSPLNGIRLIDV